MTVFNRRGTKNTGYAWLRPCNGLVALEIIVSTVIYKKVKNIMQKNSTNQPVLKYRVNIGVEIYNYQWKVFLLNIF